jgi:hypothetical protein
VPATRAGFERLAPSEVPDAAERLDVAWSALAAEVAKTAEHLHKNLEAEHWFKRIEPGRRLGVWDFRYPIEALDRLREAVEALSDFQLLLAYKVNPSSGWKDLGMMTGRHPDALRKHFTRLAENPNVATDSLTGRMLNAIMAIPDARRLPPTEPEALEEHESINRFMHDLLERFRDPQD